MIVHVCESNSNSQQTFSDDLAILADLPPNQSMMGRRSVPDYTAPELEASHYAKINQNHGSKMCKVRCIMLYYVAIIRTPFDVLRKAAGASFGRHSLIQ